MKSSFLLVCQPKRNKCKLVIKHHDFTYVADSGESSKSLRLMSESATVASRSAADMHNASSSVELLQTRIADDV